MKTAMQELIEWIRYTNKECHSIMFNEGRFNEALEKEKEQIINAFNGGRQSENDNKAIDHYNFNYNQNK